MKRYDYTTFILPEIRMIQYLGFWTSDDYSSVYCKIWYRLYRYVVLTGLIGFFVLGWVYIPINWEHITIDQAAQVICVYSCSLGNLVEVYFIINSSDLVRKVLDSLQSEQFQPNNYRQLKIAESGQKSGQRIRTLFRILVCVACALAPLPAILGKADVVFIGYMPPCFPASLFIIFQTTFNSCYGCVVIIIVCLNCNLLLGATIQIDILKDKISMSKQRADIVECIKHYGKIKSFVEQIQEIQHISLLVYFGCEVFILCTALFSITEMSMEDLGFMLPFITAMTQIIFVMCWYGSEMAYKSDTLMETIFHSNWVGQNGNLQKMILTFMCIAKNPLGITMGKGICTLSLPVFVSIIRTTYSSFTLLQKLK